MYYLVHFHADDGRICGPGIRCVSNKKVAEELAEILRQEPGHICSNSVLLVESKTKIENIGCFALNYGLASLTRPRAYDHPYSAELQKYCKKYKVVWDC